MITREQVRMARAALGWGVRELGKQAGVSSNTVSRFENGAGTMVDTLKQIEEALEKAGIIFISPDNAGGPGVRLRKPQRSRAQRSE
jgi:transcriptional regulator with XRE-family HTH domain